MINFCLQVDQAVYLSSSIIEDNYGKDYMNMNNHFKIYIYDIQIGEDIRSPHDYKYGVERMFIDLLRKSSFLTMV